MEDDFISATARQEKEQAGVTVQRQVEAGTPRTVLLSAGAGVQLLASPVTMSQAPATAKARVITHRSVAPVPARTLTVPATGS